MATGQYINSGRTTDYTATSDLDAGAVVVQNDLIGITHSPIADTETGTIQHEGVYELPKDGATAFNAGVLVYWDASAQEFTETSTSNTYLGKTAEAIASSATVGRVRLDQ